MPSVAQDKAFRDTLVPSSLLDDAISWIKDNLGPNDVFDEDELTDWVQRYSSPEDTFTSAQLTEWAELNGYVKG